MNTVLAPHSDAKNKQKELIEVQKLMIDRLEVILKDHQKELASLSKRVSTVEKK